jgi:hypothetical protein
MNHDNISLKKASLKTLLPLLYFKKLSKLRLKVVTIGCFV